MLRSERRTLCLNMHIVDYPSFSSRQLPALRCFLYLIPRQGPDLLRGPAKESEVRVAVLDFNASQGFCTALDVHLLLSYSSLPHTECFRLPRVHKA